MPLQHNGSLIRQRDSRKKQREQVISSTAYRELAEYVIGRFLGRRRDDVNDVIPAL